MSPTMFTPPIIEQQSLFTPSNSKCFTAEKQTHCTDKMAFEFEAFTHKIRGSKVQQTITPHNREEIEIQFIQNQTKWNNTKNANIIIIHYHSLTFSWSMWRSSLISRRVLFASILLSNAFAIFLMATCSFVSEFKAELFTHTTIKNKPKNFPSSIPKRKEKKTHFSP